MVAPDKIASAKLTEEPEEPLRNFTQSQLRHFDGKVDEKTGDEKPVYLSVHGIVFDVSGGRNFYGPGGPYEAFAGHECGVALAKMSFDEEFLDDLEGCEKLNFGERTELEGWIDKFSHYRPYPIKGRLIPDSQLSSSSDRVLTKADLERNNGRGEIPKGYAAAPIYIGAGDLVYDMSFGGVTFYGPPNGPYQKFAGRDASRALGKMSLNDTDVENSDISDFTDKEKKILNDWIKTFSERKQYPVVGRLKK